jgi:vacuolar-type H+-ATPase subunit H
VIEQDIIGHLIDVERLAYDLLLDAEKESDRRKSLAKEKAEQEYHTAYERLIEAREASFSDAKNKCDSARETEYGSYIAHLESIPVDPERFNSYLNSVFFGS